ncbi:GWxTD domain-containing protein [Adhaeribacter rhizoryzae]|nr:GWxTD domain-containing protein [Adhaeribacter rhizoryzae]
MKRIFTYFLILALFFGACTPRQALFRQNLDYAYIPATTIAYDYLADKDSLQVFLKFADEGLFKDLPQNQLKLLYTISLSYERPDIIRRDSVRQFGKRLRFKNNFAYVDFKLPTAGITLPSVLQLQIPQHVAEDEYLWLDIPLRRDVLAKKLLLTDANTGLPLFRAYVNTSETFKIKSSAPINSVQLKQYETDFPAALPPFSLSQKKVSPTLNLIRTSQIPVGENIKLDQEGLFVLDAGESSTSIISVANEYPELTTARELIEPLIYMTSSEERKKLYEATEPKKALDRFWLDIANQNQELAKRLIKEYYQRVKEANIFFSSHKDGWLTDRGMLYIILGKPTVVNRRLDAEEWTYINRRQGGATYKFIFIKKPNTFTQNHYELIRRPEYEFVWYSTVEKWRKGTILEE